jgi:splicing factor 3B subunit 2
MTAETLSQQPNGAVANGDLNPLSNAANGTAAKKSRESERRRRRRKQKKNRKASQAPEATASDVSDGDDVKENSDPQQVLYPCLLSRNCLVSY